MNPGGLKHRMNRTYKFIIPIVLILLIAIYIDIPNSPGIHFAGINRDFKTSLGLDLVGGVQALLEADIPADQAINPSDMAIAVRQWTGGLRGSCPTRGRATYRG
jgi:preprotein translocase subunit SecD